MIERFNSLAAAFVNCEIGEAEFRRRAQQTFGYCDDELRIIMKPLRRQRSSDRSAATQRIIQKGTA